ncbi:MAG: hypothetical protein [Podoviridae sp. ctviO18]|nr:MAG: hypothetical protein [Podoviridae sp. ctviO18]
MKARIKQIDQPIMSRNNDVAFRRIHFVLESGVFAMTDVVSTYRNYRYWEPVIASGIGTYIGGVEMKSPGKIDADSPVYILQRPGEFEHPKLDV